MRHAKSKSGAFNLHGAGASNSLDNNIAYDKTELYDKLVNLYGVGGAVKRYRDGNVIDFEVAMRYGVLRLDMSVQVLGLDVYIADALETTVLTPDDLDGLYNELKNADIIRSDKLWYISEDNIFEEVRL